MTVAGRHRHVHRGRQDRRDGGARGPGRRLGDRREARADRGRRRRPRRREVAPAHRLSPCRSGPGSTSRSPPTRRPAGRGAPPARRRVRRADPSAGRPQETVIVEGAGGLLVRLDTDGGTLLDLAAGLAAVRRRRGGRGGRRRAGHPQPHRAHRRRAAGARARAVRAGRRLLAGRARAGRAVQPRGPAAGRRTPARGDPGGRGALDREAFLAAAPSWFERLRPRLRPRRRTASSSRRPPRCRGSRPATMVRPGARFHGSRTNAAPRVTAARPSSLRRPSFSLYAVTVPPSVAHGRSISGTRSPSRPACPCRAGGRGVRRG